MMLAVSYPLLLLVIGALLLLGSWAPMMLRRLPLSLPMLCLLAGFGLSFTNLVRLPAGPLGDGGVAENQ
jgi:hypothetical protein